MTKTASRAEVQVCVECGTKAARPGEAPAGEALYDLVSNILQDRGFDGLTARKVACLGNCDCDCRLALADPDRWSWMLGDVDPRTDGAFLREVLALWVKAPNGLIPKTDRPEALTEKALGRMPPVRPRIF